MSHPRKRPAIATSFEAQQTPDAGPSILTKTADGAVPKVEYVETYQRTSCVPRVFLRGMALGGALVSPAWAGVFRDGGKKMTTLTWLASRAFNHFLLSWSSAASSRSPKTACWCKSSDCASGSAQRGLSLQYRLHHYPGRCRVD